jgi:two-component system, cell cycle response regulator DivK
MNNRMPTDAGRVVLLVQAHDDTRDMYAEFLRYHRFTPIAVADGVVALNEASRADVIVTGIALHGGMDGIELIARLRRDERTQDIPVVVLTACVLENDRQQAQNAGCDVFLPKPCLPDQVLSEIRRVLISRVAKSQSARPLHTTKHRR